MMMMMTNKVTLTAAILAIGMAQLAVLGAARDNLKVGEYTYVYPYPSSDTVDHWEYVDGFESWAVDPDSNEAPISVQNPPFISMYVEGSGSNQIIEVFNPSENIVDLTPFYLRIKRNGGFFGNSGITISLEGTIAPLSSYIIARDGSSVEDTADLVADLRFDGNDAVHLYKGDDIIDAIGDLAGNPGAGWSVAGVDDATVDHTLVRKSTVLGGNLDWDLSAGSDAGSSEWIVRDADDTTDLGAHVIDIPNHSASGPAVLRLSDQVTSFRLEAKFDLPGAGIYDVWGRVRLSPGAKIGDLKLALFGASASEIDTFYTKQDQHDLALIDSWYEFQVGEIQVSTSSVAHYVLSPLSPFTNSSAIYQGYLIDYVRVQKVADITPSVVNIISPFPNEDMPSTTVPVTFTVANFDLQAEGNYAYYELDNAAPDHGHDQLKTTEFTLYSVSSGNHILKMFLFDGALDRVVGESVRTFSVLLPPPSISRIAMIQQEFTSLGIRWESPVANAISSYEVKMRVENDDGSYADWTDAYNGPATEYVASDLVPATTYHFAVRGTNTIGQSTWAAGAFRTRGVVRVNAEQASQSRRDQLVRAMKGLNAKGLWQKLAHNHMLAASTPTDDASNIAHRGPSFLPWHRQFLREIETLLQQEVNDPTLGLMYFCWHCYDEVAEDRGTSNVWSDDFMGGNGQQPAGWKGGYVLDGPFRHCLEEDAECEPFIMIQDYAKAVVPSPDGLRRNFDADALPGLPTRQQVQDTFAHETTYDNYPRAGGIRAAIESFHNSFHVWVGGHMLASTSPNDPIFYLNHANADYLWSLFQKQNPDVPFETPGADYPPGHRPDDAMWPWDGRETPVVVKPADMINLYETGVRYADEWDPTWEETPAVGTKTTIDLSNPKFESGLDGWTAADTVAASPKGVTVDGHVFQASEAPLEAYRMYRLVAHLEPSDAAFEVALTAGDSFEDVTILSNYEGQKSSKVQIDFTTVSSHFNLGESVGVLVRSLDDGAVHLLNVSITATVISEAQLVDGLRSDLSAAPINVEVVVHPIRDDEDGDANNNVSPGQGDDDDDDSNNSNNGSGSGNDLAVGLASGLVSGLVVGAAVGILAYRAKFVSSKRNEAYKQEQL